MRYCSNCGAQLTEDTKFCPQCGAEQGGQATVQQRAGGQKRLHCPKCKSTVLIPIIENTGSVGLAGPMTRNTAMVGTTANNKNFWMCQHCGHKFRNLEDLIEEHRRGMQIGKILFRSMDIMITIIIWLLCAVSNQPGKIFLAILIPVFMFITFEWALKRQRTKWDAEERKLRKACFD